MVNECKKKKRVTELIARVEEFEKETYLFIQDGRGSFNWMQVSYEQLDTEETLSLIFREIINDIFRDYIFMASWRYS